jgi:ABC-type multidrug transport system fused ATPase/permease subunit
LSTYCATPDAIAKVQLSASELHQSHHIGRCYNSDPERSRVTALTLPLYYFLPLLIFNINTRYPLTVGLGLWSQRAQNSGSAQLFPMVVIGGLVTIIPLIALFLILQRYWRGGLLIGSIANLSSASFGGFEWRRFPCGADQVYATGVTALDGLDLEVGDGEFVVLVGPSGCGKTTALRMVAGLERITSGTVSFGGRVFNDVSPRHRDVAMVFQNYALYPHLSVQANIGFALETRRSREPNGTGGSARPPRFSAWVMCWSASLASCPAASGSGWRWDGRSCAPPLFFDG